VYIHGYIFCSQIVKYDYSNFFLPVCIRKYLRRPGYRKLAGEAGDGLDISREWLITYRIDFIYYLSILGGYEKND